LLQERFNAGYSAALAQMTWPNWYTNTQEASASSSSQSNSLAPEQKTKIYEAAYNAAYKQALDEEGVPPEELLPPSADTHAPTQAQPIAAAAVEQSADTNAPKQARPMPAAAAENAWAVCIDQCKDAAAARPLTAARCDNAWAACITQCKAAAAAAKQSADNKPIAAAAVAQSADANVLTQVALASPPTGVTAPQQIGPPPPKPTTDSRSIGTRAFLLIQLFWNATYVTQQLQSTVLLIQHNICVYVCIYLYMCGYLWPCVSCILYRMLWSQYSKHSLLQRGRVHWPVFGSARVTSGTLHLTCHIKLHTVCI